jgi:hypothetical protein
MWSIKILQFYIPLQNIFWLLSVREITSSCMLACMRVLIHCVGNDVYSLYQTNGGRSSSFDLCCILRQLPPCHIIKFKVVTISECFIYILCCENFSLALFCSKGMLKLN